CNADQPNGCYYGRAAFSPNNEMICSEKLMKQISHLTYWEARTGKEVHQFSPGSDKSEIIAIRFTPNGKNVLTARSNGLLERWDLERGKEIWRTQTGRSLNFATFSNDGQLAMVSSGSFTTSRRSTLKLEIWDCQNGKRLRDLAFPELRHSKLRD